MMTELLNDPMTTLVLFLVCAGISVASLLNSMKQGGSTLGIFVALAFAGIAAWLSPDVFAMMGKAPGDY